MYCAANKKMCAMFQVTRVHEWDKWMGLTEGVDAYVSNVRTADWYTRLVHGEVTSTMSRISATRRQRSLHNFTASAAASRPILGTYDTTVTQACIDLYAAACDATDPFFNFMHAVLRSLSRTPAPYGPYPTHPPAIADVDKEWCRCLSIVFWRCFQNQRVIDPSTMQYATVYNVIANWANGKNVIVYLPTAIVWSFAYPKLLHDLNANGLISIRDDMYRHTNPTPYSCGRVSWSNDYWAFPNPAWRP